MDGRCRKRRSGFLLPRLLLNLIRYHWSDIQVPCSAGTRGTATRADAQRQVALSAQAIADLVSDRSAGGQAGSAKIAVKVVDIFAMTR